jgi:hypothetical protein
LREYGIIHFDSPDEALMWLLYQNPTSYSNIPLYIYKTSGTTGVKKQMNLNKQLSTLHTQYLNNVYWRKSIYKSSIIWWQKKKLSEHIYIKQNYILGDSALA